LSKLSGEADGGYKDGITTITGLIDALKSTFGNRQILSDCYVDIKNLEQMQGENILRYTERTETLHQDIIEAEVHERGSITDTITSEMTNQVSIAFHKGLPYEIQMSLQYTNCFLLSELFIEAIKVIREHERRMRHKEDNQYTNSGKY